MELDLTNGSEDAAEADRQRLAARRERIFAELRESLAKARGASFRRLSQARRPQDERGKNSQGRP
jgi:hypothetical protein